MYAAAPGIWLTGRRAPNFKTIADFRRDNGPAIRKVCQQFVALCRSLDLLDASIVAIDGSKFKAVNAKTKSFTREKLKRRLGEIDTAIEKYLLELDRADEAVRKTGMSVPEARLARAIKIVFPASVFVAGHEVKEACARGRPPGRLFRRAKNETGRRHPLLNGRGNGRNTGWLYYRQRAVLLRSHRRGYLTPRQTGFVAPCSCPLSCQLT